MERDELLRLMDSYGIEYEIGAPDDEVEESINAMRMAFIEEGLLPAGETASFVLECDPIPKDKPKKTFSISTAVYDKNYVNAECLPKCA